MITEKRKNIKVSLPIFQELDKIKNKKQFSTYNDVITDLLLKDGREDKKTDI